MDIYVQTYSNSTSSIKVLGELNRASSILRDVFNDTFSGIIIDDEELFNETKEYIQQIAPSKESMVKLYQSKDTPIFEKYSIERQIKLRLENPYR